MVAVQIKERQKKRIFMPPLFGGLSANFSNP